MGVVKYGLKLVREGICQYEPVTGPAAAIAIAGAIGLKNKPEEEFWVLCLDTKNKPIGLHMVSRGSLNQAQVHPREVFKRVLLQQCQRSYIYA